MVCIVIDAQNLTKSPVTAVQQLPSASVEAVAKEMLCSCLDFTTYLSFEVKTPPHSSELTITCAARQCLYGAEIVCENLKLAEFFSKSGYLKTVYSEPIQPDDSESSICNMFVNLIAEQPLNYLKGKFIRSSLESPINVFHLHVFTSANEKRSSCGSNASNWSATLSSVGQLQSMYGLMPPHQSRDVTAWNPLFGSLQNQHMFHNTSPFSSMQLSTCSQQFNTPWLNYNGLPVSSVGDYEYTNFSNTLKSTAHQSQTHQNQETANEKAHSEKDENKYDPDALKAMEARLAKKIEDSVASFNAQFETLSQKVGLILNRMDVLSTSTRALSGNETNLEKTGHSKGAIASEKSANTDSAMSDVEKYAEELAKSVIKTVTS